MGDTIESIAAETRTRGERIVDEVDALSQLVSRAYGIPRDPALDAKLAETELECARRLERIQALERELAESESARAFLRDERTVALDRVAEIAEALGRRGAPVASLVDTAKALNSIASAEHTFFERVADAMDLDADDARPEDLLAAISTHVLNESRIASLSRDRDRIAKALGHEALDDVDGIVARAEELRRSEGADLTTHLVAAQQENARLTNVVDVLKRATEAIVDIASRDRSTLAMHEATVPMIAEALGSPSPHLDHVLARARRVVDENKALERDANDTREEMRQFRADIVHALSLGEHDDDATIIRRIEHRGEEIARLSREERNASEALAAANARSERQAVTIRESDESLRTWWRAFGLVREELGLRDGSSLPDRESIKATIEELQTRLCAETRFRAAIATATRIVDKQGLGPALTREAHDAFMIEELGNLARRDAERADWLAAIAYTLKDPGLGRERMIVLIEGLLEANVALGKTAQDLFDFHAGCLDWKQAEGEACGECPVCVAGATLAKFKDE